MAYADEPLVPLAQEPDVAPDAPSASGELDLFDAPELLAPPAAVIGDAPAEAPPVVEVVQAAPEPVEAPAASADASVAHRISAYKRAVEAAPLAQGQVEREERVDPDDRFEQLVRLVVMQQPFQLSLRQSVINSLVDSLGPARIDEVRTLQEKMVRSVEVVAQGLDAVEYSEARLKFHEEFATFVRNLQFDGTESYPQSDDDFRGRVSSFMEKERDNRTLTLMLASVDLVACMFCFYVANHFRKQADLFGAFAFYLVLLFLAAPFVYLPVRALQRARWNRAMKAKFEKVHEGRMNQLRNATLAAEAAKESAEKSTAQLAADARLVGPHYMKTFWPGVAENVLWKYVMVQQEDTPRRRRIHPGDVSEEVLGGAIGKLDGVPQQVLANLPVAVGLRDLRPED
ncbi:MAG: hypothetical protein RL199_293 [Pseudomonadota bacterium]